MPQAAVCFLVARPKDVPQSATDFEQYKARVERANSHSLLPEEERNVEIVVMCALVEMNGNDVSNRTDG